MSTLNLFPARVPIGLVQPDGTVLMTPEFSRAMRALNVRLGGPDGMGSDDLAILASVVSQTNATQTQAIEDIGAVESPDWSGQVAALLAEVQDLRNQANQVIQLQAELAEIRKELAGQALALGEQQLRAELAEVRKTLEGVALLATFRDPYRVDLTRPGPIGSLTASTGAFTTLSATGQITSTLATGTAPFSVASTTVVPNLNVSQLLGGTWAVPGAIGSTTPAAGTFTSLIGTTAVESQVQFTGQITMRPNDTRSASSRNWAFLANRVAFGDWCLLVSTTNTNDPATVKLQYSGGLVITDGFGCNGKTAQTAYSLGAAATDLASVITLANNLRTMAINNGTGA